MKERFRQSMAWLHTWGGLVFTWLLFAVFFTGTLSFFRSELTLWMQPELHRAQAGGDDGVAAALALLERRAPHAKNWSIALPGERSPVAEVRWSNGVFDRAAYAVIDPASGEELRPRATVGGSFFRNFHFSLMLGRTGYWIVGIATMVMLVALITGIVIHRRIFKDFFTFRPDKSRARAWLDAHNASSVLALPFFLVVTYTGLLTFAYVYMPAGMLATGATSERFLTDLALRETEPEATGRDAPLTAIAPLVAEARRRWNAAPLGSLTIYNPGDAAAVVDITRRRGADITARIEPVLRFDGVSGQLVSAPVQDGPAAKTYAVMFGLHVAWFAQPLLRLLLFVMGAMGCVMIASGAFLWMAKRRAQHGDAAATAGFRVVEVLTVASVAGLCVATAALLWGNRLLPVDLVERPLFETRVFLLAWLLCLGHAGVRSGAAAWREQLGFAAGLLLLLPMVSVLGGGLSLLEAMRLGRWNIAGVELIAMGTGLLLAWTSLRKPGVGARARASRPLAGTQAP